MSADDIARALRAQGWPVRRRGQYWYCRRVWPALLTEAALRALWRGLGYGE